MLLFIMIPLVLVACTIAIGPVLAMTVLSHIEQRPSRPTARPGRAAGAAADPAPTVDEPSDRTDEVSMVRVA